MGKISYIKPNFVYLNAIFGITLLILIILSVTFFKRAENISTSSEMVDHTYKVINICNEIKNNLNETESSTRGFLLTADSVLHNSYIHSVSNIKPLLDSIRKLTEDNSGQQKNISRLQGWTTLRLNYLQQVIDLRHGDSLLIKKKVLQGKNAMDSCSVIFGDIKKEEYRLLDIRDRERQNYMYAAPRYFSLVFIFSFIIFIISFLVISSELKRKIEYQKELERKLMELHRLNSDLQEFSFIASHNLQEPLRKIRVFSNLLITKHIKHLDSETSQVIKRIDASAAKMHGLMNDFIDFINIHNTDEPISLVDIKNIIEEAAASFKNDINAQPFSVVTGDLLKIRGYPNQLTVLFKCLLDNAIKFSKKDIAAEIKISGEKIPLKDMPQIDANILKSPYYRITVADNGIGFDNIFSGKIFKLFQQLDNEDTGDIAKGAGLAIAEHIMINHHGFVTAEGKTDEGAIFYLYFPIEE